MKLGAKILLTITSTFLVLTVVLSFVSQSILLSSFKTLEQDKATRNIERVMSALDEEIDSMSSLNLDWASWDDSYYFVKDRNRNFIKSNLNNETLAKQQLSVIMFTDDLGRVVVAKALDPYTMHDVPFPDGLKSLIAPGGILTTHKSLDGKQMGIIMLDEGILLVSSRPILTSKGEGPIRGSLIMGRFLDKQNVHRLSGTTHLPVSVIKYEQDIEERLRKTAAPSPNGRRDILLRPLGEENLEGYGIINDIFDKPAIMVKIDLPRDIFKQGKNTLYYLVLYLLAAAVISAIAILLLLKKSILSRLSLLGYRVSDIGRTGRLSERVSVVGEDEISTLAEEINRMLVSLENLERERKSAEEKLREANDELETRVSKRTAELLEINLALKEEISERERVEEAMKQMVYHDYLTGLPNRLLFTDRLNQIIARRSRPGDNIAAVIFLDMDRFKVVNDSLGHMVGDELITKLAGKMQNTLREGDTVARLGGDEFTILIPDLERPEDISVVVEKIFKILRDPIRLKGQDVFLTASIGIAVYPYDGTDSTTLLRNADIAMYHAKSKGGNTYEMYNPEMAKKAFERLTIGNKLSTAMERNEFILYYQPQYDLRTGKVVGAEALIRWQDPDLGLLSPASFIPIAEETGIIIPVGDWVLRTACVLNKRLHDEGIRYFGISVNVSARMFNEPGFIGKVERALADSGLGPQHLILEITESILMTNIFEAQRIIKALKGLGVKFSIDDFGTGYSSLAYLKNLSINELKIDRSFIKDLMHDPDDRLIVSAIINLAHSLNLQVIAEGVELKEQLDFLVKRGCDMVQGFYFYKPMPEEEFIALLKKQYEIEESRPTAIGVKP